MLESRIYVGEKSDLLDLLKIYNNYSFFSNPTMENLEEILGYSFDNKIKFIFYEKEIKINRDIIAKNISNEILLIEKGDFTINFDYTFLSKEKLTEIVANFLNISNPPKFNLNIFDNLYKYEITGEIPNSDIYFSLIDPIKFFRSSLFSLDKSNYHSSKRTYLQSILYKLEYSFKLTGIKGLPVYYLLMKKFIEKF